jgi:hypothetical protein
MASYTLRDSAGYVVAEADDLEDAIQEYDDRKGEKVHFDDFGITELRDRLKQARVIGKEREADGEA